MFNLGSSIAVHVQAIHGLGYSLDILSSYDAQVFMKVESRLSVASNLACPYEIVANSWVVTRVFMP
jgi:hypothetical protein